MAIASICSSPNPTISLPSLPTLHSPTKSLHSLQPPLPSSSSSPKLSANLVSGDALSIAEAAEAIALANAAVEAARDAVSIALRIGNNGENGGVWDGNEGLEVRRKRRRKRRKGLGFFDEEERQRNYSEQRILIGSAKSGYLSSKEEAELCLSLKEGARIERITEYEEHVGMPSKNINAGADKRERSVDKMLCKTRVSRAVIAGTYRGLVASIAAAYLGKGLTLQDLIQEGTIGLLQGAGKFEPERGFKLSTYVYWWIKQAIIKAVATKSRLVRLPVGQSELVGKVAEANNALSNRLRRLPTYHETAEVLNVSASTVRLVSERSRAPISLDKLLLNDRGPMALQAIIAGPDELIPEKLVERQMMKQEVRKLLETLTEREAEIVRLRYGLSGETPKSFEEVARLVKLSRERVRQINAIALSKLKQNTIVTNLKYCVV